MKRLATIIILAVPSIAVAHPGHEHVGVSESHHLEAGLLIAAVAIAGGVALAARRFFRKN